MFKKLHHLAIICSDYQRSKDFYTTVLEGEIIAENYRDERNSYKLDLIIADCQIELFSFLEPPKRLTNPEAQGLRHIAFEVDSIKKTTERLASKGVVAEPVRTDPFTGKQFTFFKDPDGLPIEIYES
jgi:glyoxylase I family protein